jgi:hypothetical protein
MVAVAQSILRIIDHLLWTSIPSRTWAKRISINASASRSRVV